MCILGSAEGKSNGGIANYSYNESKDDALTAAMKMASFAPDASAATAMMTPLPPGLPPHMYAFHQAYMNRLASGNGGDMNMNWAFALGGSNMVSNNRVGGGLANEFPAASKGGASSPASLSRGFSTGSGLDILLSAAEQVGNWT